MLYLIIAIIIFLFIFFILSNKKEIDSSLLKSVKKKDLSNNKELVNSNNSFSKWEQQHEKEVIEENERINSGHYDSYRYIEFNIAGIHYRTSLAKDTIKVLDILSDIHLIKEPNNEYDSSAVKVVYDKKRLGYVPKYYSNEVTLLINQNRIQKILVMDSGRDYTVEYPDALYVTIRVYYTPTELELQQEKEAMQKEKERLEAKAKKILEPVIRPEWMNELTYLLNSTSVESDEQKWKLKKLKDNIRNSLKSYDKAIREEKEVIANNAEARLYQYKEELEILLKVK